MTIAAPRSRFDLEYYLNRTAGEKTGGGYYLNAAQQGEPDGRWFGKGAEALRLRDGQVVRREPYLAVYTMTDPRSGERLLGQAPGGYAKFADILAWKLAAEPHATRERYLELEREWAGLPPEPAEQPDDEVRDPVAVLADCIDRDEAEVSASEYRQRNWSTHRHRGREAA